jgi:uncharacterized protein (TIRG00374 family)
VTDSRTPRGWLRGVAGLAISALFLGLTVSRVDLNELATALGKVSLVGLALTLPVVGAELVLRAARWQRLLGGVAHVPLRMSVAYLAIGYFANSVLPARLGDLARAHLAGKAFGIGRLAVLGTVLVERVADGAFILLAVAVLGLTVAGGATLASTALWLAAVAVLGLLVLAGLLVWIRKATTGGMRGRLLGLVDRVLLGVSVLRTPSIAITTAVLTVLAFGMAVLTFAIVAAAVGAELTLPQSALVMGALALSTSIPAGPGSIGTYEFVGLTIMSAIGVAPEVAVAVALLVHLVVTIPLALAGLVAAWQLHFRMSDIATSSEPESA